jgi:hypothetical protein
MTTQDHDPTDEESNMRGWQRWGTAVAGLAIVAGGLYAAGEGAPPATTHHAHLSAMMQAKLAGSQKIVSGLVSEDFDEIRRGASELHTICDATEWAGHDDQIYKHHRTELRRLAVKLQQMAEEKNLDGAAFTYMHSLSTCISCHQHCRDVLKIADEVPMTRVTPIPVTGDAPRILDDAPVRR